jgi:hypothetical protein
MRFWLQQFLSDSKAHRRAAEEIFFVCLISLLPLIILAVIDQFRKDSADVSELFWTAIGGGQLYLYSFSLFGTLFWLCQKEHENFERFEPRRYLMLFIWIPSVLILLIYALNPTLSVPLKPSFVHASYLVYALYVVLYYVLLVFDNLEPPDLEIHLQERASELIGKYEQARGD